MQDTDGGFYYSVSHPIENTNTRCCRERRSQVVWPKEHRSTAAAVAGAGRNCARHRILNNLSAAATNYLAKAKLGWQFLKKSMRSRFCRARIRTSSSLAMTCTDQDELGGRRDELYLATVNAQYQQNFSFSRTPTEPVHDAVGVGGGCLRVTEMRSAIRPRTSTSGRFAGQ